jgi:hypothetical protein
MHVSIIYWEIFTLIATIIASLEIYPTTWSQVLNQTIQVKNTLHDQILESLEGCYIYGRILVIINMSEWLGFMRQETQVF